MLYARLPRGMAVLMNFVALALVQTLAAGLATVGPTARALRVDPAVTLRHE
jgi:ABC-type lipoprotein release transport system permease subunit